MDWETNLAAVIKCTNASLEQQFRHFEDVTAEFPPIDDASFDPRRDDNVATAYLRESMKAESRYREHDHEETQEAQAPIPSYARVSNAFARGSMPSTPSTTFSEQFHRRHERKRGAAATRARDNQQAHYRGNEYETIDEKTQDHEVHAPRHSSTNFHPMYSSPTYDMAQMMEQVRLSLKLEVDARAAIAERQLSALLQLCKTTSEELDRLRVEVCANDRQLHTLDQVQSKIRQELTTQKDIGFHLQSMCGKDESWRMHTENQLLELRQMTSALREQGNSTQTLAQEKLSRSELLVQFNAAMEPIKAQIQANLQHQAQQIAEVTRTSSSSSLLLDGITQKVNRGLTDELNELRGDLMALKHHVAKIDIFQDGSRHEGHRGRSLHGAEEELEAKTKERQQQEEKRRKELRDDLLKELTRLTENYVDAQIKPLQQKLDESGSRLIVKHELEQVRIALEESCRDRCSKALRQVDSQSKTVQDQVDECKAAVREVSERFERSMQQTTSAMTTAIEGQGSSWRNKHLDIVNMLEREQQERRQALDEVHELLRKTRHQLEDEVHTLMHESRTTILQYDRDHEKHRKDTEKQVESSLVEFQKEYQTAIESLRHSMTAQDGNRAAELEQKLQRLEDTVASMSSSVAALSNSIATSAMNYSPASDSNSSAKDVSMALEKQTSVYVSTMETLLKKMQLQLQAQPPVQMAMIPPPYHGYWPSSPYAASQAPPPPLLHLPPPITPPATSDTPDQLPSLPVTTITAECTQSPSTGSSSDSSSLKTTLNKSADSVRLNVYSHKSVDTLRDALPVKHLEETKAISEQSNHQYLESPLNNGNLSSKRETALATTAKGALAEAELAKARVDSRRKQNLETKHQRPHSASKTLVLNTAGRGDSMFDETNPVEIRALQTPSTPALARSASSSALPRKEEILRSQVSTIEHKPSFPASVPSTPTASGLDRTPRHPSAPPVVPFPSLQGVVQVPMPSSSATASIVAKTDAKPPPDKPIPATASSAASNGSLPSQSVSKELVHAVPHPTAQAPPRQEASGLSISVPSPLISSISSDEHPPSLSPLSKCAAQSTAIERDETHDTNSSPVETMSSSTTTASATMQDQNHAQDTPAMVPLSSSSASPSPISHVLCESCRLPIRSDHKTEHEKSQCPKRMVTCISCNQSIQWINLEMHELKCNNAESKTLEEAIEISLSEKKSRLEECEVSLKKCRHCAADVPSLELLEHEMNCDKVLKQCPHCLRRQKVSELQHHIEKCDCRLVSCPNDCGGKFLQRGIPNHLAARCPKKMAIAPASSSAIPAPVSRLEYPEASKAASPPSSTQPSSSHSVPAGKVECKFCDEEVEASKLEQHEQTCDWKPQRCQHCNMVVISRDLVRHETSCKANIKSCPHCSENMPPSALALHTSRCSKRPIKCIRCCQLFPADAIVAHSTSCKLLPGANTLQPPHAFGSSQEASTGPANIPPPPSFPPPSTATAMAPPLQQNTRRASEDPRMQETTSDRMARRNLALEQLTNPRASPLHTNLTQYERNVHTRASSPSMYSTPANSLQTRALAQHNDRDRVEDDDDDEEDEEEYDEDEDRLTLAQVVKNWDVENVCLWLHEDVGVPDAVFRFQQKQCDGEKLLTLTESDLVKDFGISDRSQRERILSAIDAIKTGDVFSDEDEDDVEDDVEDDDEDSEDDSNEGHDSPTVAMRSSIEAATYTHPRDILRRTSRQTPRRVLGTELPSSNEMLRRISKALDNPK